VTTLETKPTSKAPAAAPERHSGSRPFRGHVIWAIFKRNLQSYFSNPADHLSADRGRGLFADHP